MRQSPSVFNSYWKPLGKYVVIYKADSFLLYNTLSNSSPKRILQQVCAISEVLRSYNIEAETLHWLQNETENFSQAK